MQFQPFGNSNSNEMQIIVKKSLKKDPITRLNAVKELLTLEFNNDFIILISRLSLDFDKNVKLMLVAVLEKLPKNEIQRNIKKLFPSWILMTADKHCRTEAKLSLKIFPNLEKVILLCQTEIIAKIQELLNGKIPDARLHNETEIKEKTSRIQQQTIDLMIYLTDYFEFQLPEKVWELPGIYPLAAKLVKMDRIAESELRLKENYDEWDSIVIITKKYPQYWKHDSIYSYLESGNIQNYLEIIDFINDKPRFISSYWKGRFQVTRPNQLKFIQLYFELVNHTRLWEYLQLPIKDYSDLGRLNPNEILLEFTKYSSYMPSSVLLELCNDSILQELVKVLPASQLHQLQSEFVNSTSTIDESNIRKAAILDCHHELATQWILDSKYYIENISNCINLLTEYNTVSEYFTVKQDTNAVKIILTKSKNEILVEYVNHCFQNGVEDTELYSLGMNIKLESMLNNLISSFSSLYFVDEPNKQEREKKVLEQDNVKLCLLALSIMQTQSIGLFDVYVLAFCDPYYSFTWSKRETDSIALFLDNIKTLAHSAISSQSITIDLFTNKFWKLVFDVGHCGNIADYVAMVAAYKNRNDEYFIDEMLKARPTKQVFPERLRAVGPLFDTETRDISVKRDWTGLDVEARWMLVIINLLHDPAFLKKASAELLLDLSDYLVNAQRWNLIDSDSIEAVEKSIRTVLESVDEATKAQMKKNCMSRNCLQFIASVLDLECNQGILEQSIDTFGDILIGSKCDDPEIYTLLRDQIDDSKARLIWMHYLIINTDPDYFEVTITIDRAVDVFSWIRRKYDSIVAGTVLPLSNAECNEHAPIIYIMAWHLCAAIQQVETINLNTARFVIDFGVFFLKTLKITPFNHNLNAIYYSSLKMWEALLQAYEAEQGQWVRVNDIEKEMELDLFELFVAARENAIPMVLNELANRNACISAKIDLPVYENQLNQMLLVHNIEYQKQTYKFLKELAIRRCSEWSVILDLKLEHSQSIAISEFVIKQAGLNSNFATCLNWMLIVDYCESANFSLRQEFINELRSSEILDHFLTKIMEEFKVGTKECFDLSVYNIAEYILDGFEDNATSLMLLKAHLYYRILKHLPFLARVWFQSLSRGVSLAVESFTEKHFSPLLIREEFEKVQNTEIEDLTVKISNTNEINAVLEFEEAELDIIVKLPSSFPLRLTEISTGTAGGRQAGINESRWRSWLLSCSSVIVGLNGTIADALVLFKKNVTLHFEGFDDCAICYAVVSAADRSTPQKQCKTCNHMFHGSCLYKWFKSSKEELCPLCRQPF